jgi:NAD(P)-dependent dehydrogenase (short-subunit alcohol dehydrogenase family)
MTERGSSTRRIRFTEDDLALFSAASHDRNPLHLDAGYARTTQFGRPVVFGVLGGLACAGALDLEPDRGVAKLTLEFVGPMFCGIEYTVRAATTPRGDVGVVLAEGARPLIKATFTLAPRPVPQPPAGGAAPDARAEAADLRRADIAAGEHRRGSWRPDADALATLGDRFDVSALTTGQVAALLWSSYLVGMEVPGRRALYSMVKLAFEAGGPADGALSFDATVRASDERFGLVRMAVRLGDFATGEIRAFVRERAAVVDDDPADDTLAGRTALVVGASRGLGAQIARALVRRGATVYASHRAGSEEAVEHLRVDLGPASSRLVPVAGDGADPDWCAATTSRIEHEHGGLDVLVCNASPTILPMWFELGTAERTVEYVADSLRLVTAPLAASLDALEARHGWLVAISSVYADTAPAAYPHYVAAKGALEGLVRAVAHHHTQVGVLLVRPPRLLGELNIPVAGESALPAETVAAVIAGRLGSAPPSGAAELLTDFDVATGAP